MICISVFAEEYEHAIRTLLRFGKRIDLVEIRIDTADLDTIEKAMVSIDRPLILSCRSPEHGGLFRGTEAERVALLRRTMRFRPLYIDVEFGSAAEELMREQPRQPVILSFHDPEGTPSQIEKIAFSLLERKPTIAKLVTRVRTWDDNLLILDTLAKLGAPERNVICFGSGEDGIYSRIMAPALGSAISYCSIEGAQRTSPGQFAVHHALDLYRLHKIRRSWKVFGIAGDPVDHSLSPAFHNGAFAANRIDAVFLPFHVEKGKFEDFYRFACTADIAGLCITAPHKNAAAALSEPCDEDARVCKAANTLVRSEGQFKAYNTDGKSFISVLRELEGDISGLKAFILGAGGVARLLGFALRQAGANVSLCSRDKDQGVAAAELVGINYSCDPFDLASANVVVNATTVGSLEEDTEGFFKDRLPFGALAIDLHYDPPETFFLKYAALRGCRTLNGLEMFIRQAALQYGHWTGNNLDFEEARQIPLFRL